ncbi:hypothetical protein GCM10022204_43730 [Microlunatus aurantiacus]|jgi:hypothetical protein|uniref:MYXO-CTERM domain-containing protein n=1 Tax=Microlunatus aurantiacus TaxID=446786 RepID=A0ABP7EHB9_9ACTN
MPNEHAPVSVLRRELVRQGRSWLLAVVCVAAGGFTIWRTDSVLAGAVAAVGAVVVLALLVWARARGRARRPGTDTGTDRPL